MKILIVGGTGRIGTLLAKQLSARGHTVISASRQVVNTTTTMTLDLHAAPEKLAPQLKGMDLIYFVAGSRGNDLLQTDLNGAVNIMKAAELSGVQRYIQLSSAFALQPEHWHEGYLAGITDYNIAKYFADKWLMTQTNLAYTILQPGVLTEKPATGKVTFDVTKPGENSLADVAGVLAKLATATNTIGKVIMMGSGQQAISRAVANV
ncbi:NAD(P)H-binding protein [Levilactobacillus enshiensis]|uniref:NAD(P)H-binding protein n=1 Tax=Levilactobacillus enshiensis TaxID=2590213 RepID=UPI00117A6FDC|nr:NAD(P)H-binding protein [Levilactobacillus enshiensis]